MVVEDTCSTTIPDYMSQIGTNYFVMYILVLNLLYISIICIKSHVSNICILFRFPGDSFDPGALSGISPQLTEGQVRGNRMYGNVICWKGNYSY